jgi:hypothetical protein
VAGRRSSSFPWAVVGVESLGALAGIASLHTLRVLHENGRWFAQLARMQAA